MIITARHPDVDGMGQEKAWDDSAGFGHVRADTALKLFASPRVVYHYAVSNPGVVDSFQATRTFKRVPGLPSPDSTYTVTRMILRKGLSFSPAFTATPMAWVRSSGSLGAKDTSVYNYDEEVHWGRIVTVSATSCTLETNVYRIHGVAEPNNWFPVLPSPKVKVALTAVGVPSGTWAWQGGERGRVPLALRLEGSRGVEGTTRIAFDLPGAEDVALEVYDVLGRLVRRVAEGRFAAGTHAIEWDHRRASGERVGAGVYLCRIRAGAARGEAKLVLLPR
jgi:hypothetical protein